MDDDLATRKVLVHSFVHDCKFKFKLRSLPGDVIMDVGCGEHGLCGKAIRDYFKESRIIFMDKINLVLHVLQSRSEIQEICEIANIEERESLRRFEGKMDKVFSTYVFQQLSNKEEAFLNVYRLLKPGGEAAILFVTKMVLDDWLMAMLKIPKWKALHKAQYQDQVYQGERAKVYCREFLLSLGFKFFDCTERQRQVPPTPALRSKEAFYTLGRDFFAVPQDMLKEFKDESYQVLQQFSIRDAEGGVSYMVTELSLVLFKPGVKKD